MFRRVTVALVAAITSLAAFGAVTLVALEGRGVAILHTTSPDGEQRRTRVWFAEDEGALWVEAATVSRPFYLDLTAEPGLTIEIDEPPPGSERALLHGRAELVPEPGGHERIRALLARKYGWADAWIGLLQDTSASRAVRIVVEDGAGGG